MERLQCAHWFWYPSLDATIRDWPANEEPVGMVQGSPRASETRGWLPGDQRANLVELDIGKKAARSGQFSEDPTVSWGAEAMTHKIRFAITTPEIIGKLQQFFEAKDVRWSVENESRPRKGLGIAGTVNVPTGWATLTVETSDPTILNWINSSGSWRKSMAQRKTRSCFLPCDRLGQEVCGKQIGCAVEVSFL
jgi:hypothetical protein